MVWIMYLASRMVVVHFPGGTARSISAPDMLDGGDVLPGFLLPVADVFKKLPND